MCSYACQLPTVPIDLQLVLKFHRVEVQMDNGCDHGDV